ncbi:MAG: ferrous iron transport protein A [Ignavibacteriales bacterium]|nr:ferrous iron transport protein A [Ignavibacteriales bacterium]
MQTQFSEKTLFDIPSGAEVFVQRLTSEPQLSERLREMGFCENAKVKCVSKGGNGLICLVCNSRIGINDMLAKQIVVHHENIYA